ncbi:MAG: ABC transporter permease [Acidobacteriota bacterium]|nr:ABC transporter permease [Acidobacteriota bacterium]
MAAFVEQSYNLSSTQEPQFIDGQRVSTNWYKLLREKVWMGRDFRSDEDQPGKDHVFILSHRCWVSRFGADPNIIGKQFRLNGEPYTAIGVMPTGPADRQHEEIWTPLRFSRAELSRGASFWHVIGRLKSGISIGRAQQEMNAVTRRIAELYPEFNKNWGASVEPLRNDFQSPETRRNLWLLLAAVSFVLLIACLNVANLLLVRGVARHREFAVRAALGASRGQLVSQLMAESLMLAGLGGVLGTLLSEGLLKMILVILPPATISPEADVRLNLPVLLFALGTTMLSGVLFGCAPALQAKNVNLNESLKQGGRPSTGGGHVRLRKILVILEFALTMTLLTGAALTIHSFVNRTHVDLGIRTDHILTFYLPVPQSRLAKPEQTENFYRELLARMEAIPGVQRASAASDTPLDDPNLDLAFSIGGEPVSDLSTLPDAGFQAVTPGYFDTFGVRTDHGRMFDQRDTMKSPRVAMVNQAFVRRFLSGADPLSRRLLVEQLRNGILAVGPPVEWQIAGVFRDVQNSLRLGQPKLPQIYVPFAQSPWPQAVVAVRTAMEPEAITKRIADTVHSLDPNLPLAEVKTMHQLMHDQFVEDRFGMALYGGLAGIALLLAWLGIYGVISFTVEQSTSEIGLRMALGATSAEVVLSVLKQGLGMAGTGLVLGLVGAYVMGRAMQTILYGTGVLDWLAFSAVAALLLLSALLACYVPARRPSSVDPITALLQE